MKCSNEEISKQRNLLSLDFGYLCLNTAFEQRNSLPCKKISQRFCRASTAIIIFSFVPIISKSYYKYSYYVNLSIDSDLCDSNSNFSKIILQSWRLPNDVREYFQYCRASVFRRSSKSLLELSLLNCFSILWDTNVFSLK